MARTKKGQSQLRIAADKMARLLPKAMARIDEELAGENGFYAAKVIAESCLPKPRPQSVAIDLNFDMTGAMTTADYARVIETHLMAGEISVSLANDSLAALSNVAKIVEATEVVARIEVLEAAINNK